MTKPTKLSVANSELTLAQFKRLGGRPAALRHGGVDNKCVKSPDDPEHYVFRCSKCKTWNCDCHGGSTDLCDACWCEENKR